MSNETGFQLDSATLARLVAERKANRKTGLDVDALLSESAPLSTGGDEALDIARSVLSAASAGAPAAAPVASPVVPAATAPPEAPVADPYNLMPEYAPVPAAPQTMPAAPLSWAPPRRPESPLSVTAILDELRDVPLADIPLPEAMMPPEAPVQSEAPAWPVAEPGYETVPGCAGAAELDYEQVQAMEAVPLTEAEGWPEAPVQAEAPTWPGYETALGGYEQVQAMEATSLTEPEMWPEVPVQAEVPVWPTVEPDYETEAGYEAVPSHEAAQPVDEAFGEVYAEAVTLETDCPVEEVPAELAVAGIMDDAVSDTVTNEAVTREVAADDTFSLPGRPEPDNDLNPLFADDQPFDSAFFSAC